MSARKKRADRCFPECPDYKKPKKRKPAPLFLATYIVGGNMCDMIVLDEKALRAALIDSGYVYNNHEYDDSGEPLTGTLNEALTHLKTEPGAQAVFIDGDDECKVCHLPPIKSGVSLW